MPLQKLAFIFTAERKHKGIIRSFFLVLVIIVQRVDEINPFADCIKEIVRKRRARFFQNIIAEFRHHVRGSVRRAVETVRL